MTAGLTPTLTPVCRATALWAALILCPVVCGAVDLAALWDFARPEVSEQRFRAALETAKGDDALILQTQIARTHGLRRDFAAARAVLAAMEPAVAKAGPEAQARYQLELGRTDASASHVAAQITPEAAARARTAFDQALRLARAAGLDGVAIDAIHMFAFVDTAPADQLRWGTEAFEIASRSQQADARRWEPSIRHNMGYALHQLGRYPEALAHFQAALAIREKGDRPQATHVARWMVAWTLRAMGHLPEALQIQLALESSGDASGKPDRHVYEELELIYRAQGDNARAAHYKLRKTAVSGP